MNTKNQEKIPWPLAPLTPANPLGPESGHEALLILDAFLVRVKAEAPHCDIAKTHRRLGVLAEAAAWCKRFDSFSPPVRSNPEPPEPPDFVKQAQIVFGAVSVTQEKP